MRRIGRVLLAAGAVAAVLLLAAVGALMWLLTTAAGFDWALERARPHLPETVTFEHAEGRLTGPIEVRGLRLRGEGGSVRIERIHLRWEPVALLGGRIQVERLDLETADIRLSAATQASDPGVDDAPPSLPSLPDRIDPPLAVAVDALTIGDIRIHRPDGAVHRIDRLHARLRAGPDELRLTDWRVRAPRGDLDGRLRLRPQAPYVVDGRIEWRARPPAEVAPMEGALTVDGTLADLQLVQRWTEPASATVTADLRLFETDTPAWSARVEWPRTRTQRWWVSGAGPVPPELATAADLRLEGSLERAALTGTLDVEGLPGGALRARIAADADAERVRLSDLRVQSAASGGSLRAEGRADLVPDGPRFDLALAWRDLGWPPDQTDERVAVSETGTLKIEGTADDYTLSGSASLDAPGLDGDSAHLSWQGAGSTDALDCLRLSADWREAALTADGAIRWAGPGRARFEVSARDVDPALFDPSLRGRLDARVALQADWHDALQAEVELRELSGELNGRALSGSARAAWRDSRIRLDELRLAAGDARLRASGVAGDERVALDWNLDIPRLEDLLPEARGRIQGRGSVTGDPDAPAMRVDLGATGVRIGEIAVDSLQLAGELADAGRGPSRFDLDVRDARVGGEAVQRLDAELHGTRAEHRLGLELASDRGAVAVAATGAVEDTGWAGRLRRADLVPADLASTGGDPWALAETAALAWRSGRFELERACWTAGEASVCLRGEGQPGAWQAAVEAERVPVGLVGAYGRGDLTYTGRFGLSAEFSQHDGPVIGEAQLRLAPGRIEGDLAGTGPTRVDYGAGRVQATLSAGRLDAMAELPLAGGGRIAAAVGVERDSRDAPAGGLDGALEGHLQADIHDLGIVTAFVPDVSRAEGELEVDLRVGGTVAAPWLSGEAALRDGRVALNRLGIELTALRTSVETGEEGFRVAASAHSGEGTLSTELELAHEEGVGWSGAGVVEGESFTAVDRSEIHAVVSPDFRWQLEGRDIVVDGRVEIPAARIEPRDLSGTVQASPDAVIVRDGEGAVDPDAEIPGWRVSADVRVLLGEDVRVNAFGLDADLGGDIRIEQKPGRSTNATGELRVTEGTYTIYRQTLTIERGRVLFASGPLSDPGLDIRAVRRPRDVLVGVNVRGTLREPRAELFSDPPMEESQVLSYLVAGIPLGETSGGERSSVAAAAAAVASSRQGERLASGLGIEEVTVEQEADGPGSSLVLGRYLSPRLYVGYGIGLLEQADSVRMRYDLGRRWMLEARSGGTSSADLLYSIERD